jgi:hypothetical protein
LLVACLLAACGGKSEPKFELANPQTSVAFYWVDTGNPRDPSVYFVGRVTNPGHKTLQQTTVQWQYKTAAGAPLGQSRRFTLPNVGGGATFEFVASETGRTLQASVGEAASVELTVAASGLPLDVPATPFLKTTDIALNTLPTPNLQYEIKATLEITNAPVAANKLQRWVILEDAQGKIVGGDGGGLLADGALATLPAGSKQQVTFQSVPTKGVATKAVVYAYVAE